MRDLFAIAKFLVVFLLVFDNNVQNTGYIKTHAIGLMIALVHRQVSKLSIGVFIQT